MHSDLQTSIRSIRQVIKSCVGPEKWLSIRYTYVRICSTYVRICLQLSNPARYKSIKQPVDIIFFSDNRSWYTVKPVLIELLCRHRALRLAFVTCASKEDLPGDIDLSGIALFTDITMPMLKLFDARIFYSPFAELAPAWKPPNARLVHSLASLASLDGTFVNHYFDGCDYILCGGPHHLDSFREWASRRPALSGKWLIPAGYPKLDFTLASHSAKRCAEPSVRSTVVYAPTHVYDVNASLASLRRYGEAIVSALLAAGHRVIFRPHPTSFVSDDRTVIDRICQLHEENPSFYLDKNKAYAESYSSADLVVTDLSGTGFTFSFGFCRPCIFFAPNVDAERRLSGIQFETRHRIGAVVRDIDEMIEKASEFCTRDMTDEIVQFRDETVFRVGKSSGYIVDCLEDILSGCERPEWIRL